MTVLSITIKFFLFFCTQCCQDHGVRQMQTADMQTRAWASQTRTSVSQTSTPVSQNYYSTSVRLFRLDGIGNTIYNLPVCICQTPSRSTDTRTVVG